jgi:hypothetical protein
MKLVARSERSAADLLVALLRAELGSAPRPPAEAVAASDWRMLEQMAETHGVAPFLELLLAPFAECVPADARLRFELRAIGNRMRNRIVGALLHEIDAQFAAVGVPVLLLKGAALLHTLYGEAGPRALSDIDVLVPSGGLEEAGNALGEIGFAPMREPNEHFFRRSMHTVFQRPQLRSIAVEVHWDLAEPYRPYAFDLDAIWSAARPLGSDGRALRTMSNEHTIAYLCLHLERHAIFYRHILDREDWFEMVVRGGVGSRLVWLYDVALCMRRWGAAVDWERLVECSNGWAIAPNVRAALQICRRVFLVEPPGNVIERLDAGRAGFVEAIAARALAVPSSDASSDMTESRSQTYRNATLALNVAGFLTPSAAYLRRRYAADTRLPLLRLRHLMAAAGATVNALMSILRRAIGEWMSALTTAQGPQPDRAPAAEPVKDRGHSQASPYLMAEQVRTSLAVYDPEHNTTHLLNPSAARVLALCDGSRTAGAIAAELRCQLNAGSELEDADVGAAIDLLIQTGLVSAETKPGGMGPDPHPVIAADLSPALRSSRL